jgi:hypothetical protein
MSRSGCRGWCRRRTRGRAGDLHIGGRVWAEDLSIRQAAVLLCQIGHNIPVGLGIETARSFERHSRLDEGVERGRVWEAGQRASTDQGRNPTRQDPATLIRPLAMTAGRPTILMVRRVELAELIGQALALITVTWQAVEPEGIATTFELRWVCRQGRRIQAWARHSGHGCARRRWIERHDSPSRQDEQGGEETPPFSLSVCRMTCHQPQSSAPGSLASSCAVAGRSAVCTAGPYPPLLPRIRGSMMSRTASPTRFQPRTKRINARPG